MKITLKQKCAILEAIELPSDCSFRIDVGFALNDIDFSVYKDNKRIASAYTYTPESAVNMAHAMRYLCEVAAGKLLQTPAAESPTGDPFLDCERIAEEATTL